MKKRISIGIIVAVLLVCILALVSPWKANAPENGGKETSQTLTGKVVCLPKPGDGPHTLECALGLQASNGKYYALKNNPQGNLPVNQQIRVTGKVIPPSSNETYDIVGTVDVESLENIE